VSQVVPLQALGVIDVGATHVGDNEMFAHALANTSSEVLEMSYAIKRSGEFVNKYARTDGGGQHTDGRGEDPNHLLGAFPTLYCYGKGAPETKRWVDVPYNIHIHAALQHYDKRFTLHLQFIFQAFGILQKHQICSAACLQVRKKDFLRNQEAFRALTPQDLLITSSEESRKVPFSNPTVKSLRSQLTALQTKVMGTDESRVKIRGQIKGMCIMKGPPSLWITINPSDTGDPIAQVFAGEKIDMDRFIQLAGPNSDQRSKTIVADPYVAAKFFSFCDHSHIGGVVRHQSVRPTIAGCEDRRDFWQSGLIHRNGGSPRSWDITFTHCHVVVRLSHVSADGRSPQVGSISIKSTRLHSCKHQGRLGQRRRGSFQEIAKSDGVDLFMAM
jgi:hypothetical protein